MQGTGDGAKEAADYELELKKLCDADVSMCHTYTHMPVCMYVCI